MITIPNSIRTKVTKLVDRLYDMWDDKDEFKKTLEELENTLRQVKLPKELDDAFSYSGYAELFLIANYDKSENLYFYSGRGSYTASDVLKDLLQRKDKLGKQISDFVYDFVYDWIDHNWIDKEVEYDEIINEILNDDEFCQSMLEYLNQKNLITLYTLDDIRDMYLPVSNIKEAFEVDFLETLDMDKDIYYEIKEQLISEKLMFILDLCLNDYEDTVFYREFTLNLNNRIIVMDI